MNSDAKPKISVVATLYNSEKFIFEFITRIKKSINELSCSYEILLVDDGSKDNSVKIVENLSKDDPSLKLIKFSRNFGHHKAMVCGLCNTIGDYVFLIDIDLEEQPELIIDFYTMILQTGDDLIYGVQEVRNKDKFLGALFWRFAYLITGLTIGNNACTVRIMTKNFVEKLRDFPQRDFFLGELSSYIGLKQSTLVVNKTYKGYSSYNFFSKFALMQNMIFTNSNSLWVRLSFLATLLSIGSFILFLSLIISYLLGKEFLSGWLSLMVVITFFSTVNFLFFGLLLQLISKLLEEVKAKPRYIIDKQINIHDYSI